MIQEALREEVNGYPMYEARRSEFATSDTIPFHVADQPFQLAPDEYEDLQRLSGEVATFMEAADSLSRDDEELSNLLDRGKSELFRGKRPSKHVFLRPDLIVTESGFAVCEIETSPFGLGLAHALNSTYLRQGHETIVNGELNDHVAETLPDEGAIVYSQKTKAYRGQLRYLAERVFSEGDRDWIVEDAETQLRRAASENDSPENIYRAFYLHESDTDPTIREVIERGEMGHVTWTPSLTPHFEEKAVMSLLWDDRWDKYFRDQLGSASYKYLKQVIPPTFVVGEEGHFTPGLPGNVANIVDIADLPRSKRALVLKSSGYDDQGSWAESVQLLHQKSKENAARLLAAAALREDSLQIVQEFRRGKKIPISYTESGLESTKEVRVRLTPYVDPASGKIIAAKATGRAGTDFIHASTDSINSAVGVGHSMKLVIFDWKWTLYHPPSKQLLPGARDLIDYLHSQDVKTVIIGKDQGGDMDAMVDKLDVRNRFSDIQFITSSKTPELFGTYASDFSADQVWVVGDRIRGEVNVGNAINANTVWMRVGTFSNELPESASEQPDYTFTSLTDLLDLFRGGQGNV